MGDLLFDSLINKSIVSLNSFVMPCSRANLPTLSTTSLALFLSFKAAVRSARILLIDGRATAFPFTDSSEIICTNCMELFGTKYSPVMAPGASVVTKGIVLPFQGWSKRFQCPIFNCGSFTAGGAPGAPPGCAGFGCPAAGAPCWDILLF